MFLNILFSKNVTKRLAIKGTHIYLILNHILALAGMLKKLREACRKICHSEV